jgi:nitrogen fixation/metabolism regulation signal transduction histidine kinase
LFRFEYNEAEHRSSEDIPEIDFDQELNGKLTGKFILKQGDPIEYVKFPKGALTKIFDNIVSNACAHGFVGREEANNIIKIKIDNVGSDYIVSVSNNGEPLDTGMKCEEITIYGQTSGDTNKHFGIGGYEIKRLMEEFGDSLEIISEPNAEFTVTYKLIFHDTNITSSFTL